MLAFLSDSIFRGKKMNTLLGTIITALVTDENDRFYFVQKDGVTFALAKDEGAVSYTHLTLPTKRIV